MLRGQKIETYSDYLKGLNKHTRQTLIYTMIIKGKQDYDKICIVCAKLNIYTCLWFPETIIFPGGKDKLI